MSNWHVGMKVVCIQGHRWKAGAIVKGRTYTVAGVTACNCRTRLSLAEVPNLGPGSRCAHGCGWSVNDGINWIGEQCFRPIDPLTETMDRIEAEGCPELEPVTP